MLMRSAEIINSPIADSALLESDLYEEWKRYGQHIKEYASEFVGTAFFMFCVVGVVAMLFATSSPAARIVPSAAMRLFFAGLFIGSSGWLVALSPPGRLSGAHLNPAVTIGFWLLKKMHGGDMVGYVIAQMLGAVGGAAIAHIVFGHLANEVSMALLRPAKRVGAGAAFFAETGATFALTFVLYTFVSRKKLLRWTPVAVTLMAGIMVCLDGDYSGAGMNPARWFGPAAQTGDWQLAWVYLAGPIVGAVSAALLRRSGLFTRPVPATGKVFHDPRYRSVFRHDKVPTKRPSLVRMKIDRTSL